MNIRMKEIKLFVFIFIYSLMESDLVDGLKLHRHNKREIGKFDTIMKVYITTGGRLVCSFINLHALGYYISLCNNSHVCPCSVVFL